MVKSSPYNDAEFEEVITSVVENRSKSEATITLFQEIKTQYYWEPIDLDGARQGFVLISTKMTELKQAYTHMWWLLTISFALLLL